MTRILLTGFEPFGGEPVNPSREAVRLAAADPMDGIDLQVRELPCAFGAAGDALAAALRELRPAIVIGVGQAGGRSAVGIERVAINVDDARIADNAGRQPIDEAIVADGPAAYFATLPVKAILAALRAAGIPAEVSQSAGTYVCNHVFYRLMHLAAGEFPGMRGGFLHLPYAPDQAVRHPGAPSMTVEMAARAVRIAAATSAEMAFDLRIADGATH